MEFINPQGQQIGQHIPLASKDIKQLKEAAMAYETHAPFIMALLEYFVELNLMPSDYMQFCRACLLGRDYLLRRGEIQENCTDTAWQNAIAGSAQCNLNMLTSAGEYVGLAAQITYDLTVYAQIAAASLMH